MDDAVARVRDICLALPDLTAITFKPAPGVQEALVAQHPARFFVPRYVGHKGRVGARLDAGQDWQEIAELIEDSFRLIAPRRLVAELGDETPDLRRGGPGKAP